MLSPGLLTTISARLCTSSFFSWPKRTKHLANRCLLAYPEACQEQNLMPVRCVRRQKATPRWIMQRYPRHHYLTSPEDIVKMPAIVAFLRHICRKLAAAPEKGGRKGADKRDDAAQTFPDIPLRTSSCQDTHLWTGKNRPSKPDQYRSGHGTLRTIFESSDSRIA